MRIMLKIRKTTEDIRIVLESHQAAQTKWLKIGGSYILPLIFFLDAYTLSPVHIKSYFSR